MVTFGENSQSTGINSPASVRTPQISSNWSDDLTPEGLTPLPEDATTDQIAAYAAAECSVLYISAGSMLTEPVRGYILQIVFDTNDEMADELCEIIIAEMEKIAAEGPLADDVEKTREYLLKNYKKLMEQNSWWRQIINEYYDYGLDYQKDYEAVVSSITGDDVKAMMQKILDDGNHIKVMMRPEK